MNFALVGEKFTTKLVYHLVSFGHQPMNFSMKFFVCLFVQYATCNLISKLRWVGWNGRILLRT